MLRWKCGDDVLSGGVWYDDVWCGGDVLCGDVWCGGGDVWVLGLCGGGACYGGDDEFCGAQEQR